MVKVRRGLFETNSSSTHSLVLEPCGKVATGLVGFGVDYEEDNDDIYKESVARYWGWFEFEVGVHKDEWTDVVIPVSEFGSPEFKVLDHFFSKFVYLLGWTWGTTHSKNPYVADINKLKNDEHIKKLVYLAQQIASRHGHPFSIKFMPTQVNDDNRWYLNNNKKSIYVNLDHEVMEQEFKEEIDGVSFEQILEDPDIMIFYRREG